MLAGLLKKVAKAASKTATKSEANAARKAIRANPKIKGEKEDAAIAKITQAEKKNIDAIVKRGEDAKPKKKFANTRVQRAQEKLDKERDRMEDARKRKIAFDYDAARKRIAEAKNQLESAKASTAAKRKQSPKERESSAIGRVSGITTTQRNKKEGVGSMVSYTSMERAAAKRKAKRDLDEGLITKAEYDRIIKAIDAKNAREKDKVGRRASQSAADMKAKTPTTRKAPLTIPAEAKGVKGLNMNKGGYANCGASMKPTQKSTKMAYGGMSRKK